MAEKKLRKVKPEGSKPSGNPDGMELNAEEFDKAMSEWASTRQVRRRVAVAVARFKREASSGPKAVRDLIGTLSKL